MDLILWSGGSDSTLVLKDRLATGARVRTLAVNHEQLPRAAQGRAARTRLREHLLRCGHEFDHVELTLTQDGGTVECTDGIVQPVLWLLHATPYLGPGDDLYAGYVRGDDVWHHKEALHGAFGWLLNLLDRQARLLCPLEWTPKVEVLARLRDLGLLDLVWYCEGNSVGDASDDQPCGRCPSCRTHATALWQLESWWEPSQAAADYVI